MNDINVCRLRFFVAEVPEGCALSGRVWGLLVLGGVLAAALCASKRKRNSVRTTVSPATGRQWRSFGETLKPRSGRIRPGIHDGECHKPVKA